MTVERWGFKTFEDMAAHLVDVAVRVSSCETHIGEERGLLVRTFVLRRDVGGEEIRGDAVFRWSNLKTVRVGSSGVRATPLGTS